MSFKLEENVRLGKFTTIGIGGAARFFVSASSENDAVDALEFAAENDLEVFILGGGSNVLIADAGFDGLILQVAVKGISVAEKDGEAICVTAGAGEDWDGFVEFCVERRLQGVECLSGIPGFVGGTPVQNVGAYGQEVAETIQSVRCFDREMKKIVDLTNEQCRFSYRASIFNTTQKNRRIVLSVRFALRKNGAPKIGYRDLQNYFAGKKPTLSETRRAVIEIRARKSMVLNKNDVNSHSAGSFFKNPVVDFESFDALEKLLRRKKIIGEDENAPFFAADEDRRKIPAAWLIEKAGFYKGFRRGSAAISANHTLSIVNLGGASAREVLDLMTEIQAKVQSEFGIRLKPEPVFVGF